MCIKQRTAYTTALETEFHSIHIFTFTITRFPNISQSSIRANYTTVNGWAFDWNLEFNSYLKTLAKYVQVVFVLRNGYKVRKITRGLQHNRLA